MRERLTEEILPINREKSKQEMAKVIPFSKEKRELSRNVELVLVNKKIDELKEEIDILQVAAQGKVERKEELETILLEHKKELKDLLKNRAELEQRLLSAEERVELETLRSAIESGRGKEEHPKPWEARELLGNDFLGPQEVKTAFGLELEETDIPELPYTKEDLEKAKERGEMLILRASHDSEGHPLTMERMQAMFQEKFTQENKGKVLFNTDWYKNEPFFTQDTPQLEWKLVSKKVLPNSTSKDYINQTKVLCDSLKKDNLLTPAELKECTDQKLKKLRQLMVTDWQEAAKQLSELLINQNHRRKPVEALYDLLLRFSAKDERLLQGKYDWTNIRSSGGLLVRVGFFAAGGAGVYGWGRRVCSRASGSSPPVSVDIWILGA